MTSQNTIWAILIPLWIIKEQVDKLTNKILISPLKSESIVPKIQLNPCFKNKPERGLICPSTPFGMEKTIPVGIDNLCKLLISRGSMLAA